MPKKKTVSVVPSADDDVRPSEVSAPIEPVAGLTQELLAVLMAELEDGVLRNLSEIDEAALERAYSHHPIVESLVKMRMMIDYVRKRNPPCWSKLSEEQKMIVWQGLQGSVMDHIAAMVAEDVERMPESEGKFLVSFYEMLFARYTPAGFFEKLARQKSSWLNKEWHRFLVFVGARRNKRSGEKQVRGRGFNWEYVLAYKYSLKRKRTGRAMFTLRQIIRKVNEAKYGEVNFASDKGVKLRARFKSGIARAKKIYGGSLPPKEDWM